MGLIREFREMPGSVKVTALVLGFISLCCIAVFLIPLIILVIAYPAILVPIAFIAIMAVIGAFSIKHGGIHDSEERNK